MLDHKIPLVHGSHILEGVGSRWYANKHISQGLVVERIDDGSYFGQIVPISPDHL